jgi:Na+-driven multidrug efflux pump
MSILQVLQNALAGSGKTLAPMFANMLSHVVIRQIYLFAVSKLHYTLMAVAISYPLAWVLGEAMLLVLYFRSDWSRFEHVRQKENQPEEAAVKEPVFSRP